MAKKRDQECLWMFWFALFLIIIGIAAVIMLALHTLGII